MTLDPTKRVTSLTYNGTSWPVGIDTSDADATAADIAYSKTAYVNDSLITGTSNTFSISATQVVNLFTSRSIAAKGYTTNNSFGLVPPSGFENATPIVCGWNTNNKYLFPNMIIIIDTTRELEYLITNWYTSAVSGTVDVAIRWYKTGV